MLLEKFPFMRDHAHKFQPAVLADLEACLDLAYEKGAFDTAELLKPEPVTMVATLPEAGSGEYVTVKVSDAA